MSALLELFPYKFYHGMYVEGGGSGLKYFSYQMSTGTDFEMTGRRRHRTVEQCIKHNGECKVHYRDAVLNFTDEDYRSTMSKFNEAMDWYVDAVFLASPCPLVLIGQYLTGLFLIRHSLFLFQVRRCESEIYRERTATAASCAWSPIWICTEETQPVVKVDVY